MSRPIADETRRWQGRARIVAWSLGAAAADATLVGVLLLVGVTFAMAFATLLRLDEAAGVPIYWAGIVGASVAHGFVVDRAVRSCVSCADVPWTIWPAMMACPIAAAALPLFDLAGARMPLLQLVAVPGLMLAWLTLGSKRWSLARQ